jgi:hypothetical protein
MATEQNARLTRLAPRLARKRQWGAFRPTHPASSLGPVDTIDLAASLLP